MAPLPVTDDYYLILEVEQNASAEIITKSYRRLAFQLHPDRNSKPDATAAFQLLGRAYETLGDAHKRRAYDLLYPTIKQNRDPPNPPKYREAAPPPFWAPPRGPRFNPFSSFPQPPSYPGPKRDLLADQIAALKRKKAMRNAAHSESIFALNVAIFDIDRLIRNTESQIKKLVDEHLADLADESLRIYVTTAEIKEEKARRARKKREREAREAEKAQKEAVLRGYKSLLEMKRKQLKGEKELKLKADLADDKLIQDLQAKMQAREGEKKEKEEKERAQEAQDKEEKERIDKLRREGLERERKAQAESEARKKKEAEQRAKERRGRHEQAWREQSQSQPRPYGFAPPPFSPNPFGMPDGTPGPTPGQVPVWGFVPRYGYVQYCFTSASWNIPEYQQPGEQVPPEDKTQTSACIHEGWWPKVQGRVDCPLCNKTWNYMLECPGCKKQACPECQKRLRPY